jgi:hypothetical protein
MSHEAWVSWQSGIRCGLCGPPFVLMTARIEHTGSDSSIPTT